MFAYLIAAYIGSRLLYNSGVTNQIWRSVNGDLNKYPKNPYFPTETGYLDFPMRRLPQFFYARGKKVIGDVSPLNPVPYVAVVPERRNLHMSEFGFACVDPRRQAALIDEKFNLEEHPRLDQSFRVPLGKKSWRRHNVKHESVY